MKAFIILTAILAVAQALPLSDSEEQQWQKFKEEYGKTYETEEEENMRKEIFAQHLKNFEKHNKKYEDGLVLYTVGINQFTDMTHDEFVEMTIPMDASQVTGGRPFLPLDNVEPPKSIDWREKGVVTDVKDQGLCGSCYAFSATGALEAQLFKKTGKLVSLSEQNLVDCSSSFGNNGCRGGLPSQCFQYIKDNAGIDTEKSYPYEGVEGKCRYESKNSAGTDRDFVKLPEGDENALLQAVATVGPISIGLNGALFHTYQNGIMHGECDPEKLTHGVLIVGYGTSDNGTDYWIVKNSWGKGWGENGYVRIIRNKNQCGLTGLSSYPLV